MAVWAWAGAWALDSVMVEDRMSWPFLESGVFR